jgi:hypothetical protein
MNESSHQLHAAKFTWLKRLISYGHMPLTQGCSFECCRCGLSGSLDDRDHERLNGGLGNGQRCEEE